MSRFYGSLCRWIALPDAVNRMIVSPFVTDRRTDRQTKLL